METAKSRFGAAASPRLVLAFGIVAAVVGGAAESRGDDFERGRSTHFLLLHDLEFENRTGRRGSGHFERGVLDSLETSYRALDASLGLAPRRRIDVVVHDPARFDLEYARHFRFPSAGFFADRIHIRGTPRIDLALEAVLAHELVHAALDQEAPSLALPAWMNEGIATWFEARRVGKTRMAPTERSTLSSRAANGAWLPWSVLAAPTFSGLDVYRARQAYLQSYALVDHLVVRRGERALRDWVRRTLRTGDPTRSLERASGLDPVELEESLLRSLGH